MTCRPKYNTGNPLCSNSPLDLSDNAQIIDAYVNSSDLTQTDRLGHERKTLAGINADAQKELDSIIPKVQDRIDKMIVESGGVEIASEWGNRDDATVSQKLLSLSYNNARLLSVAINKLKKTNSINIVCVGDSITYGYDENSADKLPPLPGHVRHRAPIQYPAQLESELRRIYSSESIKVVNYGYSGDTVKSSYNRNMWKVDPECDLAVMMFGINDSGLISIDEYLEYSMKWIQRLNDWGIGVVIASSTLQNAGGTQSKIQGFRAAARKVADLFSCPLFVTDEFPENYSKDLIYSDGTHFNKEGYKILGNSVAWFIAKNCSYDKISSNTILSIAEYNIVSNGAVYSSAASYNTNMSLLRLDTSADKKVTFPFYLDCDAAEIFISGYVGEGTSIVIDSDNIRSSLFVKRYINTTDSYNVKADLRSFPFRNDFLCATIIGRGWHSVTITSPQKTAPQYSGTYIDYLRVGPVQQNNIYDGGLFRVDKPSFMIMDPMPNDAGVAPPASRKSVFSIPMFAISKTYTESSRWPSAMPIRVFIVGKYSAPLYSSFSSECIIHKTSGSEYSVHQIFKSSDDAVTVQSLTSFDLSNAMLALDRLNDGWINIIIETYDAPMSQSLLAQ